MKSIRAWSSLRDTPFGWTVVVYWPNSKNANARSGRSKPAYGKSILYSFSCLGEWWTDKHGYYKYEYTDVMALRAFRASGPYDENKRA